jgi:hypothetical protein
MSAIASTFSVSNQRLAMSAAESGFSVYRPAEILHSQPRRRRGGDTTRIRTYRRLIAQDSDLDDTVRYLSCGAGDKAGKQ